MKLARFFSIAMIVPVMALMVLSTLEIDATLDFLSMGYTLIIVQVISLIYRITHDD